MNLNALAKAYEDKVLDRAVHARLLENLDAYAEQANIPSYMVLQSMHTFCGKPEVDYMLHLRRLPQSGIYGMLYKAGENAATVHTRMMALTAACLRNFINARVMTVQDVIAQSKSHKFDQPTVLCLPNFFIRDSQGGKLATWDISVLLGVLYERHSSGLQTVVYVDDMMALGKEYGQVFKDHIENHFFAIKA